MNPNLIQLPDTARDKIDEGMRGVGDNIVAVTEGIKKQAQDPWSVEDVWLILVWHWLETRGRRMAFDPFEGLTRDPKLDSGREGCGLQGFHMGLATRTHARHQVHVDHPLSPR